MESLGFSLMGFGLRIKTKIRNEVEDFYVKLYKEECENWPLLNGMNLDKISISENSMLERRFSEDEVWKVVSSMKGDKSPGPDGFSISFLKRSWDTVKGDLMKVFEEFYYLEEFYEHLEHLNNSFIVLILKKIDAKKLKDLCPISLHSSVYKIIAKTLSSRLKLVLNGIIAQP